MKLVAVVGFCTLLPVRAGAASDAGPEAQREPPGPAAVAPDSPRASLQAYLDLCREGRFGDAARHLDLGDIEAKRGPELARRLKAVLDHHVWFDLEAISSASEGNRNDDLPPFMEEIAQIPTATGKQPVRLSRRPGEDGPGWAFSAATVGSIDTWFDALGNRWLIERLPAPLLRTGPRDLLWWQWLALPLVLLVAWLAGLVLSRISRTLLVRFTSRTATPWDDAILARIGAPLTTAWTLFGVYLLLPMLGLYEPALAFMNGILRGLFFLVVFWVLLRSIDIVGQVILTSPWAQERPASRSLVPLGTRVGKVFLLAVAVVALLAQLGYPIASLVAGLGIGGLALALAAQKTVENLFGAFSIGVDQPIREGDFVRIEDFVGTVESIGLRSTRVRTLDRTVVTIPNGRLADMRLETFAARDRIRLHCTLGVVYGTTAAQMRQILEGIEHTLRSHPKIWPEVVNVRFQSFGDSSLNIEVMAWFQTADWSEFLIIRQEVLLQFMDVVEKAGTSFAFPTRTVHVVGDKS